MSTVSVPVNLDAVEERILPQLSLRGLGALLAAALAALLSFHLLDAWPAVARVAASSMAAALSWSIPTAALAGATPAQWLARIVAYALSPKELVPGRGGWPGVAA